MKIIRKIREKITVRMQLVLILTGIVLLFIVLSLFGCAFFLERYYVLTKKNTLIDCQREIQAILLHTDDPDSSDLVDAAMSMKLFTLELRTNVSILLTDAAYNSVYNLLPSVSAAYTAFSFSADENQIPPERDSIPLQRTVRGMDRMMDLESILLENPEILNGDVFITDASSVYNKENNTTHGDFSADDGSIPDSLPIQDSITFISKLSEVTYSDGSTGYVLLRTSVIAMNSSVQASSQFVLYISIVIFIIGIPVIFLVSKRILKPIVRITDVAKKMSSLDFSQKLEVKTADEIGKLSEVINRMSGELDRTINELNENLKVREQIDSMRKEFIANVSHELKTPISLIGGYAEGLKLNVGEEEKDMYCDVIIDETVKMNKLVIGLLDLSQIEAGFTAMEREEFDCSGLVANVLSRYTLRLAEKSLRLEASLPEGMEVLADSFRIEQAFKNLLENAISYTPWDGIIRVSVFSAGNEVILRVYNDGPPIEEEHMDKVWHSFYKADRARNRERGGQGLGLSIVRTIIEAHHGRYGAENRDGGVLFWFALPGVWHF